MDISTIRDIWWALKVEQLKLRAVVFAVCLVIMAICWWLEDRR